MTVKLRYKLPDGETSRLMELPVRDGQTTYRAASADFKFASAVAAFGMVLRDSEHKGDATFGAVLERAEEGKGRDYSGYRAEFVRLVKEAQAARPSPAR